jgi:hypothetical protein
VNGKKVGMHKSPRGAYRTLRGMHGLQEGAHKVDWAQMALMGVHIG